MKYNALQLSQYIKTLGVPASLKGYRYIHYALCLCLKDRTYIEQITKRLYPAIAAEFNTMPARVERAIRHAVETGWSRGDVDFQNKLFGFTVSADRGKPTNGEFIATLVDYILLQECDK